MLQMFKAFGLFEVFKVFGLFEVFKVFKVLGCPKMSSESEPANFRRPNRLHQGARD